ncbi:phosphorylase [Leptospira fletcheri]|uniref:Phosphorylase n=1 Tax=Leptospira fletcheri TaxID=2484981 RepID=A0A4R9GJC4_9LEPT|nr:phosphorylase [Leptospira fletcheri]TGK13812.1 phosphorylase [Leptospira fletcheri]
MNPEWNLKDILFCGAFSGEIDRISVHADLKTLEVGVGNLNAALRLQSYLLRNPEPVPKAILFLGSAGVYPWIPRKEWEGKIGFSRTFTNYEIAYLDKKIRIPEFLSLKLECIPFSFPLPNLEFFESGTNGTGSVTIEDPSPRVLERLKTESIGLENMEVFGLAKVAQDFQIPFAALFSLTNRVGPKGSEEWKSSWRKLSERLQESLLSSLPQ